MPKRIRTRTEELRERVRQCGTEYIPKELFARRCDVINKKKQWRKLVEEHLQKYGLDVKGLKEMEIPYALQWKNNLLDSNEGIMFLFQWADNDYRWKNENIATVENKVVKDFKDETPMEEETESTTEESEGNTIFIPVESIKKLTKEEQRIMDKIFKGEEDDETNQMLDKWTEEAKIDANKLFESQYKEEEQ